MAYSSFWTCVLLFYDCMLAFIVNVAKPRVEIIPTKGMPRSNRPRAMSVGIVLTVADVVEHCPLWAMLSLCR